MTQIVTELFADIIGNRASQRRVIDLEDFELDRDFNIDTPRLRDDSPLIDIDIIQDGLLPNKLSAVGPLTRYSLFLTPLRHSHCSKTTAYC